jgi:hypothetical protein
MLHLIPQTYKTAIKYRQPFPTPAEPRITCSLGKSLVPRCGMAVPVEGVPTGEEDREKCEWWKAKKWVYGILGRLFHRFGIPLSFRRQCRPSMVYLQSTL